MPHNYCTLFNSNYLSRGLAMYQSLQWHTSDFHLYIFAFDDKLCKILNRLMLPNVTVISLKEFEDDELLEVKKTRSQTEYCWTCTPSIILFSIQKFNLSFCTYLDADIYFYANPSVLIDEIGVNSILLTEHHYTPRYNTVSSNGKYCVQFMTFKNDDIGLAALQWWREKCNEWCYERREDGKFGDQKYLDDWTERYQKVVILQNPGGGVAPWNVQQYRFINENYLLWFEELNSGKKWQVIFYHFHSLKFIKEYYTWFKFPVFYKKTLSYADYDLSDEVRETIYFPYLHHLLKIEESLGVSNNVINLHAVVKRYRSVENLIRRLLKLSETTTG